MDEKTVDVWLEIVAWYSLFLIIFGTLANAISIVVCLRHKLRKVPTFVFYTFMLAGDTLSIFFWNLDHYYLTYFGYEIEEINLFLCQFSTFIQIFGFQSSAWLLVKLKFNLLKYFCSLLL